MVIRTLLSLLALLCCNTVAAQTFYVCEGPDTRTAQQIVFTDGSIPTASVDSITLSVPRGQRFVGGDISVLTKYEQQQATYLDRDGKAISDVLTFLREQGWNTMRVRLFVDPSQDSDKNVCQDLDYVTSLAQRIKAAGLLLMLDFHYSDTWADPGKQTVPKSWKDFDLAQRIYDYTRECLSGYNTRLELDRSNNRVILCVFLGATVLPMLGALPFIGLFRPAFIGEMGNEISFGMLWESGHVSANSAWTAYLDTNWSTLATYLRQASKACREVCPRAQIIIHTEQCANNPTLDVAFFKRIAQYGIDYDIIGVSYYPYFKGPLGNLDRGLTQLEANFPTKQIQVVETGYPSKWAVGGTSYDYTATYPYTHEGQRRLTADLITTLRKHPRVNGLSWWYAEANAKGCTGDMKNGWYNASLFDNETGRALPALYELKRFK